jgi:uncharacterized membrane protein
MTKRSPTRARRWPLLLRVAHARPRLLVAGAVLIAAAVLLPVDDRARRLLARDLAVATFLALVMHLMRGATVAQIRARSADEDEGRLGVLCLTVGSPAKRCAARQPRTASRRFSSTWCCCR